MLCIVSYKNGKKQPKSQPKIKSQKAKKRDIEMELRKYTANDAATVQSLFYSVFSDSEGESEGAIIRQLVDDIQTQTPLDDRHGHLACYDVEIVGAIFFTRMHFDTALEVFLLSPVAVATKHQGRGIGQTLLKYGLGDMQMKGVDAILTYGSPEYYAKVGFHPISPEDITPPFRLSQPHGWLGQSLTDEPLTKLPGKGTCIEAFAHPSYW